MYNISYISPVFPLPNNEEKKQSDVEINESFATLLLKYFIPEDLKGHFPFTLLR